MMNIFSSFNPLNFVLMSSFLLNFMIVLHFWNFMMKSSYNFFLKKLELFMNNDFSKINNSFFMINNLISLYIFNFLLNLTNLLPFSFCMNSQLNSFFIFCFTLWFCCILLNMKFFMKNFMIHLTPLGCPMVLSPLMVLIEFISLMIRPITLSVRMSANMLAGHLLIHLLSEFSLYMMNFNSMSLILMMTLLMILNLLEMGVAVVQPYILCVLINMYYMENN